MVLEWVVYFREKGRGESIRWGVPKDTKTTLNRFL